MGAEVLEEGEMEPFVTELEGCVAGKTIGLFGSYGWGDGEWMRDWVERMTAAKATVVGGEGVITAVNGGGELRLRLLDMGLIPGTAVKVIKIAPLGDPIEITPRGYELTIRREHAKEIDIRIKEA